MLRKQAFAAALVAAALSTLAAAPAGAREVDRQEVAERFDVKVPQVQRLHCHDTRTFTLTDGTQYRACVDWRAQNRTRIIRSYAALDGPDEDTDENLDLARDCFDLAVASQNDPYREMFEKEAFLAGANAEFSACALARQIQRSETYSLRVYETGVWLGGR